MIYEEEQMRQRINTLIHKLELNQREFANKIGRLPSNLSLILSGGRHIPRALGNEIIKAFPNVRRDWLLFGEGDMYEGEVTTEYKISVDTRPQLHEAVIDGYLKDNVYVAKGIKVDKGKTRIDEYLTAEEVATIQSATMPTKSLSEAKDLFLFQCYTGLAYIDMMSFDFKTLKETVVGEVVNGVRHKTGTEYTFVLTDDAKAILEKYNYRLPKLPNQKYNIKLKLIADAAGIDKNITSHVGRRSAGSIWLNSGIPLEIVSKCMGHSSIITTQKSYAKVLDETIKAAFAKTKK